MIFVPEAWRIYTDELHRQFRKYFATWAPAERIAIGDVGFLDHARFVKVGTLEHFGLARLEGKPAGTDPRMNFQSQRGLKLSFGAEVSDGASAEVSIAFSNKSAVLFNALNCTHTAIDLLDLQPQLLDLVRAGVWCAHYVVVRHVVRAEVATIAFGGNNDAQVSLRGQVPLDPAQMNDPKVQLEIARQSNCALVEPHLRDCTPLFGLAGVRRRLLGGQTVDEKRLGEKEDTALQSYVQTMERVRSGADAAELLEASPLEG